jgi:hypothetical protein
MLIDSGSNIQISKTFISGKLFGHQNSTEIPLFNKANIPSFTQLGSQPLSFIKIRQSASLQ